MTMLSIDHLWHPAVHLEPCCGMTSPSLMSAADGNSLHLGCLNCLHCRSSLWTRLSSNTTSGQTTFITRWRCDMLQEGTASQDQCQCTSCLVCAALSTLYSCTCSAHAAEKKWLPQGRRFCSHLGKLSSLRCLAERRPILHEGVCQFWALRQSEHLPWPSTDQD